MRTLNQQDSKIILEELVPRSVHLSLATVSGGGKPWVCEVHFVYDQDFNIWFRSLASRRHSQDIAGNPNVSGNICKQHSLEEGCSGAITFEGTAEIVHDELKLKEVMLFFESQLGRDDSIIEEAKDPLGHQFYKIAVSQWYAYGKLLGDTEGTKYSLSV